MDRALVEELGIIIAVCSARKYLLLKDYPAMNLSVNRIHALVSVISVISR